MHCYHWITNAFIATLGDRMMEESDIQNTRGYLARVGVTLLNLIQPGLGLLRLAKGRLGLLFPAFQIFLLLMMLLVYLVVPTLTFTHFFAIFVLLIVVILVSYLGSIILTWKMSKAGVAKRPWWSRWYSLILIYVLTLGTVWPITYYTRTFNRPYFLPAESMRPTLEVGDKLIAKMRNLGDIKRGDLVVVSNTVFGKDVDYIKRIAAVPGDSFELRRGFVVIDNVLVNQTLKETRKEQSRFGESATVRTLEEQFPGEARPHRIMDSGESIGDDWGKVTLDANQYFLLGDNRDNSADSRFSQEEGGLGGAVSRERIKGKPLFVYWSKKDGYAGRELE